MAGEPRASAYSEVDRRRSWRQKLRLMVEHIWIRIAEIREQAAEEEWIEAHPHMTRWRSHLRYIRVCFLLARKRILEHDRVQTCQARAVAFSERASLSALALYLVVIRHLGCRPRRWLLHQRLSNRELKHEIELRGLDHTQCVEKSDLLEILCGPEKPFDGELEGDPCNGAWSDEDKDERGPVDKMV